MARLMTFDQAAEHVVSTLQEQLPLGLWAITRRDGHEQLFVEVRQGEDPADGSYEVTRGTVVAWQGSLCEAMVDGAPAVTADAAAVPEYAATAPVHTWPVRTYLASTITNPDGGLYGTLCGYGAQVGDPAELTKMAPVVDLLADLLGQVLLAEQLREQATDREAHLYHLATRDHLTGLSTRAVLHDRLDHALELHGTSGKALTLMLIDVDDFKIVNDTHGHAAGDALLAHLGRTWAAKVHPGNTLARIGGDEFALLIETDMSLQQVLSRVYQGMARPITVPGASTRVTTSVGIAHLAAGEPAPTGSQLLADADHALYTTKRTGKAGVSVHTPRDDQPTG